MSNNLSNVEKNLRTIAKRYENVKYSVGLAVLFLMKGTSAFSDGNIVQEAEKQKDILTSVKKEKTEIKETKKKTKATPKLKASWASMQFGVNDMYSNFFATPKIKVEKTVLVASADNSTSLPMFAKLLSDIEETTDTTSTTPTIEEIQVSKENLRNSVGNLQDKINTARRENSKEINGLRLELVQLMEQGNQVVKSPWASWQFGVNYMYDNWRGAYKGRGDKAEKYPYEGVFTRSANPFERYTSPESENYGELATSTNPYSASTTARKGLASRYGLASTVRVPEPIVTLEFNAGISPREVLKKPLSIEIGEVKAPDALNLSVSANTPKAAAPPEVKAPTLSLNLPKPNTKPFNDYSFKPDRFGDYETGTTTITQLKIEEKLNSVYTLGVNPNNPDINPDALQDGDLNNKAYRLVNGNDQGTVVDHHPNARFRKKAGTAVWRINNKYKSLRDVDNESQWLSDMKETDDPDTSVVHGFKYDGKGVKFYLAGDIKDDNSNLLGINPKKKGAIGLHSVWNGRYDNINGFLKGRTAMFSIETWHAPKLLFKNVKVDIEGNENTLFYIYPATHESVLGKQDNTDFNSFTQRGAFIGEVNADIKSQKNAIYSIMGISGAFNLTSTGTYKLEGANNLVYSSLGYSPNFQNFIGNNAQNKWVSDRYKTGMTPVINLKKAPESYGDGNVIMYFSDLIPDGAAGYPDTQLYGGGSRPRWRKSKIGIFQGEVRATARIGEKLNIAGGDTQTEKGNTGDNKYVENNVGILAQSGQRGAVNGKEITPTKDLGVDYNQTKYVNKDKIHALYVNDIDITFGKYSKSGIMVASERGTQVDVAVNDPSHHTEVIKDGKGDPISGEKDKATIPIRTKAILDYNEEHSTFKDDGIITSSTVDADNEAATGTIIGYAKGSWKDSKTRMGNEPGVDGMSSDTRNAFKDAKSEINFGTDVKMSARYAKIAGQEYRPVAYAALGGKITAKNTTAYGYGSVIAYATNENNSSGEISIAGNIEAKDEWAANDENTNKEKYKNIGAFAKGVGTKITVTGNATINGLGAFADDKGRVSIQGTGSVLNSGNSTALAALNGGHVTFGGGTINVGDNAKDDSTPFYADSASKMNFTGTTKIKMTKGTFLVENTSNYQAAAATTNADGEITDGVRYNGMGNVDLEVSGDAKIVKNSVGENVTWTGTASLAGDIKGTTKINKLTASNANFELYYSEGNYTIDADAQLGKLEATDSFDAIKMTREKVTINPGKKVYSTTGKGLAMASSKGAANNSVSGYKNNGIVDISGGDSKKAAINVSYGLIKNNGTVKIDKGIALYGTNGSKIENTANGVINVTNSGYGIVGMATGETPQDYGTDAGASGKVVEIVNNGQINVAGDNAVAIYADDNKGVDKDKITITNTQKITLTGDRGVGIALRDSKNSGSGGVINVSGTGSSDIATGTNGIGIYAENSDINLDTDYGIETKDNGIGIYAKNSSILTSSTLKYKYSGSTSGRGIAIFYTGANITNNTNINLVNSTNTIAGLIGIFANGGGTFTNNGKITGSSTAKEFGIIGENTDIVNSADITLGNASSLTAPNIALYSKTNNSITNNADLTVGDNSIGIYGHTITNIGNISVGKRGSAIYSLGGDVNINSGTISVGDDDAVGVYTTGNNQTITATNATTMDIGEGSFGFANVGKDNKINSNIANVSLKNNSIYIYSKNKATINNSTNLTSTGTTGNNYGIYASGTVTNTGDIDFRKGIGNVGIYSTYDGKATNSGTISVGASYKDPDDSSKSRYSIGMAAGFIGNKKTAAYSGNIVNEGTINVTGKDSIGMYGVGSKTTVYNGTSKGSTSRINLGAEGTVGIYLDKGAKGWNYGTITTVGNPDKATGVVVRDGAEFTNEGTININSAGGFAFVKANGGIIKNYGTFNISGGATKESTPGLTDTSKIVGGVEIDAKPGVEEATIKDPSGKIVKPALVPMLTNNRATPSLSSIGMYIDTLRGTNPINGLGALNLKKADLIVGSEASQKTTNKYIEVDQRILGPYNKVIKDNPQIKEWGIYSGAFTWIATGTINKNTGLINKLYMAKIPYTKFAGNKATPVEATDTYNFLDGLEQRYGVEGIGTRENGVFQKLNSIGKNEGILFYQAVDEMMGHQYANTQQRIHATGQVLSKEFDYLRNEWQTFSKDSNKVKVFGITGEYKTNTAGVIDYKNNAYGVAYVHEDETVRLGKTLGWYTGIVHNTFRFKDIGSSKEEQLQAKLGVFKSVPFDYNNSLNWTISGEVFTGYNKMHRKFLVVDEIFNARSKYYTYGVGIKNELSKSFRLSEDFTFKPYASLNAEYGRMSKIREKSGEIKLEVKSNDYFSVRPEIGAELGYKHQFDRKTLRVGVAVAYENELGRIANGRNKARVVDTTADWFNIKGEEDRRGNIKTDLNIGLDNQRYGVNVNIGYDTKGDNVRAGVGLRVIF